MEFKKCERCGCFFDSENSVCSKCEPKDNFEKAQIKGYLLENQNIDSITDISVGTGISAKSVNRFLQNKEFASDLNQIKKENNSNINL